MIERAPRKKKRLSCDFVSNGSRYSGIAIDLSATGLFIQTNVKPKPGSLISIGVSLPGAGEPVVMEARVARKKNVPPELLTIAQGGIGLALVQPCDAYLDFVAGFSPEHADAVKAVRAKTGGVRPGGEAAKAVRKNGGANGVNPERLFRVYAVETTTGKRNSFLVSCATEQAAESEVMKQLGDEWQALFVERA